MEETSSEISVESEWISISKKKSSSKKSGAINAKLLAKGHAAMITTSHENESPEAIAAFIKAEKTSVASSTYYQFLVHSIFTSVGFRFDRIIAFGLGNLTSETSKLQLILYLCLCESLLSEHVDDHSKSIFDPCISDLDRKVLELLSIPILSENTKGKHSIGDKGTTLFYLPHCPYRLYCNILWANWDHFDRLYFLGNSFQSYSIRRMGSTVSKSSSKKSQKSDRDREAKPSVDSTDTVALLTRFITEVDLWPATATTFKTSTLVPKEEKKRKSITISNDKSHEANAASGADAIAETEQTPPVAVAPVRTVDRNSFLKEAKTLPALRCLENAMCDMSLMHFPADSLRNPALVDLLTHQWASEAQIDEAAALDDELF